MKHCLLFPLNAVYFLHRSLFLELALQVDGSLEFSRPLFFLSCPRSSCVPGIFDRIRSVLGCSLIGLVSLI